MPELFLELFSEEIPARMQANAAAELARSVGMSLIDLDRGEAQVYYGPRRIALCMEVSATSVAESRRERGPRIGAPEVAVAGFLRKHRADRSALSEEDGYYVITVEVASVPAAQVIASAIPPVLRRFPWPKSMRWGGTSAFTWVRPLRRIVCLLDGEVVPFSLRDGPDDGHGLVAANLTEGHRFHAPGAFTVSSCANWAASLAERRVLVDADDRKTQIAEGLADKARGLGLEVADDAGLLAEVAGLVEWPVPMLGRIDDGFMDLPAEVMQVSMRVNQRYFSLRRPDGGPAPWFGFIANIEPNDDGTAVRAGNERVLRARFADARHFWDLDRRTRLAARVAALDGITFHTKLGSQGARVRRLRALACKLAPLLDADPALVDRAAELSKADLSTGMVGEFPELQGVMGRYYALHDGEPVAVADAIRDHYSPRGPHDDVPPTPIAAAVALADKLDQLAGFFLIGEAPTGSGDPYALRRAALGIIRIVRERRDRFSLAPLVESAMTECAEIAGLRSDNRWDPILSAQAVLSFIKDRLLVHMHDSGFRHDTIRAVFRRSTVGENDDLNDILARAFAIRNFLDSDDGANLLVAYRRAANILRIENRKDGPHEGRPNPNALVESGEKQLYTAIAAYAVTASRTDSRDYAATMSALAALRWPLDNFFTHVTVNAPEPQLRRNRLALLANVRDLMHQVADFSQIEG